MHDIRKRKDLIVAIDVKEPYERLLHTISPSHVLQCCMVDHLLYVLDSNQHMLKLSLTIDSEGWPRVSALEDTTLSHLSILKDFLEHLGPDDTV